MSRTRRAAVIGAGASGIAAVRELLKRNFEVTCFEARKQSGGAWVYSEAPPSECIVSYDEEGRPSARTEREVEDPTFPAVLEPSPMYRLRTNIPADGMSFRDFPFAHKSGPFPRDDEVLKYIQDYAIDVERHVKYSTLVRRVSKPPSSNRWCVQWQPAGQHNRVETLTTEEFDHICDASGHYTVPYIPRIDGLWSFRGRLLHAKWYRSPETFAGQNVLVIGNRASGSDIGRQIASMFAREGSPNRVYQAIRNPFQLGVDPREGTEWSSHLQVVAPVGSITETNVHLTNGSALCDIDVIIFATGYLYSFPHYHSSDPPFHQSPLVRVPKLIGGSVQPTTGSCSTKRKYPDGGLQVHNIDNDFQTFYVPDPTLAFLCLNKSVIPFPLAQVQAHAAAKFWSGETNLHLRPICVSDEDTALHTYGNPKEFDVADALLTAIGEGNHISSERHHVNNGTASGDESLDLAFSGNVDLVKPQRCAEILPDGRFPATSHWRRQERPHFNALRRKLLGY